MRSPHLQDPKPVLKNPHKNQECKHTPIKQNYPNNVKLK